MRIASNESDARTRHLQQNLGAKVERVVINALVKPTVALTPDVLRLRRRTEIVFGEANPPSLPWAVNSAATSPHSSLLLLVWDYRCAFSSCRCTCFFSLRTSVNWLWRSGN